MDDIRAAAQAHLASLPQHLKSRYSAVLIANLVEEIEHLQELRQLDGESLGKSVEEYNRMKELCIDGKHLTDEEREVLSAIIYRHRAAEGPEIRTIRDLLARFS